MRPGCWGCRRTRRPASTSGALCDGGRSSYARSPLWNTDWNKLDEKIAELKVQQEALTAKWQQEKGGVDRLQELKEKIAAVKLDIEKAERDYKLNDAAELKFATVSFIRHSVYAIFSAAHSFFFIFLLLAATST